MTSISQVKSGLLQIPGWRLSSVFIIIAGSCAWMWQSLDSVLRLSLQDGPFGHYSHIVLIPFLSGYLLFIQREKLNQLALWQPWLGFSVVGLGIMLSVSTSGIPDGTPEFLSLQMLSMIMVCWGAFLCCYGVKALQEASFGLLILLAMVPLPPLLLDPVVSFLQKGSAEGVDLFFQLLGIPAHRQGVVFSLSNVTIEIAPECSGIRSSLALIISSLVAGHLLLRSMWRKVIIVALVVPLALIKNSLRITVLSLLGNYVDPKFLMDSALHSRGGIPLFFLSLGVILGMIWMLRRWESGRSRLHTVHI